MDAKRNLNVIDLDGTLLPYDSLRVFLLRHLSPSKVGFRIALLLASRVVKLKSRASFLADTLLQVRDIPSYSSSMECFAKELIRDFRSSIIDSITKKSDRRTINVLCSASPVDYVGLIGAAFGWEVVASDFVGSTGRFLHVYGENKVKEIRRRYPENEFHYHFAISDDPIDNELLSMFECSVLAKEDYEFRCLD